MFNRIVKSFIVVCMVFGLATLFNSAEAHAKDKKIPKNVEQLEDAEIEIELQGLEQGLSQAEIDARVSRLRMAFDNAQYKKRRTREIAEYKRKSRLEDRLE